MAIKADLVPTLRLLLEPVEPGGRIMTFGRQTVQHPGFPDQESLFRSLGFDEVHSLDTSAYEGCTHLHDLNDPVPPADLVGRYRTVFTGGTLEHVFEFTNALRTAVALLEPGGWLLHLGPVNGWVDHGFYQLSPTLFFDWLTANGFELNRSLVRLPNTAAEAESVVAALYPGEGHLLSALRGRSLHLLSARKLQASTNDRTPLQSLYAAQHGPGRASYRLRAVAPYTAAEAIAPHPLRRMPLSGFAP